MCVCVCVYVIFLLRWMAVQVDAHHTFSESTYYSNIHYSTTCHRVCLISYDMRYDTMCIIWTSYDMCYDTMSIICVSYEHHMSSASTTSHRLFFLWPISALRGSSTFSCNSSCISLCSLLNSTACSSEISTSIQLFKTTLPFFRSLTNSAPLNMSRAVCGITEASKMNSLDDTIYRWVRWIV